MLVVMAMLYCHFTCFNWLGLKALKLVALSGGRLGGWMGWERFCQTRIKILALTTCCFFFLSFFVFLNCFLYVAYLSIVERLGGGRFEAIRHTLDF